LRSVDGGVDGWAGLRAAFDDTLDRMLRPLRASLVPLVVATVASCGNAAPPPPSTPAAASAAPAASSAARAVEPPDEAMPKLHTGALQPIEVPGVRDLHLVGRYVADGLETLEAQLPDDNVLRGNVTVAVDAEAKTPLPVSFVPSEFGYSWRAPPHHLWIRRPTSDAPVTGDLYLAASGARSPGHHARFRIADPQRQKSDPAVRVAWLRALAAYFSTSPRDSTPWSAFASARLGAMADTLDPPKPKSGPGAKRGAQPAPRARATAPRPPAHDELAQLMDTTTGATAVQEALQQNRALFLQASKEPATLPIASLEPPRLAHHPWPKMLAALGKPPPLEPFASDAPADFYYARAADLTALFRLVDQVDAWGTPGASLLDDVSEERDLSARYETQLGLRRGPLTRALGPAVVGEVAIVGSDPYWKEGSDLTVLLRVKSRALFDAALAGTMADLENAHGALTLGKRDHGGVSVSVARSPDGAVAQQRATVGEVEIVSNSTGAMDLVLDTIQGRHPRLADEPDFQFMLARDASERADVLAYMGDRFVSAVVGPRQKVLEARRAIALGELMTPGLAALLYGVMQGKSAARVEDLFSAGLLARNELAHTSGAPIAWKPGSAARSSWGTPAAMTPLIDLPAPATVTASEKASYERFARSYQNEWSAYVDPVALRMVFDGATLGVSMRELPLIDGTQYRDIARLVGSTRFSAHTAGGGARLVAGLGADSEPRRELSRTLRAFSSHDITFDWVGNWAAVGTADRSALAQAYLAFDENAPQIPGDERSDREALALALKLPVYAEVAVKSTAQAAIALAAVRVIANETIPGMFDWGEAARHRDVPIVRVAFKRELTRDFLGDAPEVSLYYAVTEGALILTLQPWLIEKLIDEQLDGTGPTARDLAAQPQDKTSQFLVDVGSDPGKPLWSTIAWMMESEVLRSSRGSSARAAEALLRGAPEIAGDPAAVRALALATFGAVPVSPDGDAYTLSRQGIGDAARGTEVAPVWPDVPVTGSPVARVMQALARVQTQVAFDDEGKDEDGHTMLSLRARATFGLR
jgi:hypothetical protein